MLAALLAVLLGLPAFGQQTTNPGAEIRRENPAKLEFSTHARRRMEQRGVSQTQAQAIIDFGEKFQYFHEGKWKTGYFDEKEKLFLATDGVVVITVITQTDRGYINRLKRKKP